MIPHDPIEYLSSLKGIGMRLGLEPVTRLLRRMGNPQRRFKAVLVGGTNGKGSIAALTASILTRGGYRTGLYTSPHLVDFSERIKVDGKAISGGDLRNLIGAVRHHVLEDVTYFEFTTALAFLHFFRAGIDVAVLEVGLGGRLDATNVANPAVAVISNISLEHRAYLGRRLTDIAHEKGGIIKPGGLVVTAARQKAVIETLEAVCRGRGARLFRVGGEIKVRRGGDRFSYFGIERDFRNLRLGLLGRHQVLNAACALGAVELLGRRGIHVDDGSVREGLAGCRWEGRLEVLRERPMVVVDGAHNPAGASVLREFLEENFSFRKLILVFGVLADKDYRGMLRRLVPLADHVILTRPREERALPPDIPARFLRETGTRAEVVEESGQALARALGLAEERDLVCITGSLYLVGETRAALTASGKPGRTPPGD
ncbi:MAG TPA: folylpolyglutamate synthase/dihydrofolate synthase family protein [Syntrophales bacterium]|nr:folylpolyglutamate synthase/dihydrofolate synthase family protein [Syntrophales bacterium]HOX95105.1 folylpolyglutamate synthase/dihydrofolate synthase family protein [Syntrophales bacterium]HPI57309.1 folylpolyglutamate synthase/dihydrofolate synthase family protein [Syntrophales bacterium]HPN25189.1 folylpolyglutamate synthase/dihydrofolate synthase family protein [Syntrophales bacterium]HQM29392.1 folylpolyglutamate synthase/dihydrofolate synthase family protein [Syntrophales bacterium]